ncbi:ribonuclease H-like domain-containing protein [Mycena metata]|uniref:Ribonuclease H-like domain-containing protein n=1 Tax=Mycena metata TaxID=1033252 RepID=A0AAD7IQB7_9AGAR|nr:ribonuclease H-like domain-containing protein [Mycena metata]
MTTCKEDKCKTDVLGMGGGVRTLIVEDGSSCRWSAKGPWPYAIAGRVAPHSVVRVKVKKFKNNRNHKNAWCKAELDVVIAKEKEKQVLAAAHSSFQAPDRTDKEWYEWVQLKGWCAALAQVVPICGKIDQMRVHITKKCLVIEASSERQRQRDSILARLDAAKTPTPSHLPQPLSRSFSMPPPDSPFSHYSASPHYDPRHSPSPFAPPLSPLLPMADLEGLPPAGGPFFTSDAFESPTSELFNSSTSSKRRRTSETSRVPAWNEEQQTEFGADLCKLFVVCGWSWNTVSNPEFKGFFQKYLPQASLPDRRVLSGEILDAEAAKVIASARRQTNGKLATYSEDGWTNISKTHVDTSIISVEGTPHLLKTHDMTGRPKTGDELYGLVQEDIKYAQETYDVEVIAVCTDDGPDGKKMRRLTKERSPWIAVFECWGHQAHLITGDYLKIKAPWMAAAKLANEIIKFFNHHQFPLDLLRAQEMLTLGHFLALLLPVLTQWLSQYCSMRRLKKLERQIKVVIIQHEDRLRVCLGRKPEQIAAAEKIIETCKDEDFWKNLERIATHLEPLAIASNILQAPSCRLDMVLLTLGNLYRIFGNLPAADSQVTATVQASLERRWGKTDQELMILFSSIPSFRLLRQDATGDAGFLESFNSYYDNTGLFSDSTMWIEGSRALYEQNGKPIDLVAIWRRMDNTKSLRGQAGFVALAVRILSILPNSAGPERVFSEFGMIHTKRRNRLNPKKVHNTSLVRADRMRTHAAAGLIPKRNIRRCSLADNQEAIAAMEDEEPAAPVPLGEQAIDSTTGNFDAMAAVLVNLATQDSDDESDDANPPPPRPSASTTVTNPSSSIPAYKKITLEKLFTYPVAGSPSPELDFCWRGGRTGVDAEEAEMLEAQTGQAAGALDNPSSTSQS